MTTKSLELLLVTILPLTYSLNVGNWVPPIVCSRHAGCMWGTRMAGYRIDSFEAFMGIPYAMAPVGELRFSHPQPYPRWRGILNTTQSKADCIQKDVLTPNSKVRGDEDCLYLNVYRPKPKLINFKTLPVMVYIHGGGFFAGSANPNIVGPEYIMDTEEVILVTIAYRLGIFGFLSTNDSVIPGNFGLKDQTLALRWVQQNIGSFGGDPDRVALFGQSAGGISTHMHMLSKASEGLFEAVISQSGTASLPLTFQLDPLNVTRATAKHCNIPNADSKSSKELLESLRSLNVEVLMSAGDRMKYWFHRPTPFYGPVVEHFNSHHAFLTEHPLEVLAHGNYRHTRFMAGVVPEEGAVLSIPIWEFQVLRNSFNEDFRNLLESVMHFPLHFNRSKLDAAMDTIIVEYFEGNNELTKQGLLDVFTDRVFLQPFYRDTMSFLRNSDSDRYPLQLYSFNYKGPYSYTSVYSGGITNLDYGVVHADELLYLFRSPALFPDFPHNSLDAKVSQALVRYFVDFAINRNSTLNLKCRKENFPLDSIDSICDYIVFQNGPSNNNFVISTDNKFNIHRMRIWEEILKD